MAATGSEKLQGPLNRVRNQLAGTAPIRRGQLADTIYLPQADEVPDEPELPPMEHGAPSGSEVVLLVEDEDNIREPAVEILEAQGYSVLPARDGAEALEISRFLQKPFSPGVFLTTVREVIESAEPPGARRAPEKPG